MEVREEVRSRVSIDGGCDVPKVAEDSGAQVEYRAAEQFCYCPAAPSLLSNLSHVQGPRIVLHLPDLQARPPLFSHAQRSTIRCPSLRAAHARYTSPHHAQAPQTLAAPVETSPHAAHVLRYRTRTSPPNGSYRISVPSAHDHAHQTAPGDGLARRLMISLPLSDALSNLCVCELSLFIAYPPPFISNPRLLSSD